MSLGYVADMLCCLVSQSNPNPVRASPLAKQNIVHTHTSHINTTYILFVLASFTPISIKYLQVKIQDQVQEH